MNSYLIEYSIHGTETIDPLTKVVYAISPQSAKQSFLASKDFYNTNDPRKVVITSIRIIGNG